ncbi:hypothetical protein BC826DRAFT_1068007 [Russula brevipes]|nr:hypothetical protein BC826DRAFT_1068007 [Russula brevipes]
MGDILNLPPELLCQIALHFPLTRDILTFSLIHPHVRQALLIPALFKARLAFQGWDVSAWQDQDDYAALGRWMRIDHIHCRTVQLFEDAAVDSSSSLPILKIPASKAEDVIWGLSRPDPGLYINPQGRDQMVNWLRKLSRVLPAFITHHRGDNISRITEPRHRCALWAYARVVFDMCSSIVAGRPKFKLTTSEYGWFERACFSLMALFMQCDASTILSVIGAAPFDLYPALSNLQFCAESVASSAPSQQRYFASFLVQAALHLLLLPDAVREPRALVPPPSLPYIDPLSCYDEDFDLGTSSPMRPWLRNGLAGTPLAGLSLSEIARPWVGYYTTCAMRRHDPPMFLELRSTQLPEGDCVRFHGEGHDRAGAFSLGGNCDTRTGVVTARKSYLGHRWEWRGMITPFGMVGTWGTQRYGGWWWIWPREWSVATT